MFTGIIEGFGTVRGVSLQNQGMRLSIESDFELSGTRIGDSISVNGTCLTAVTLSGRLFTVDVAPETLTKSTHRAIRTGDRVNLERALKLTDRLDGHIVSGHVDGTGVIRSRKTCGNAIIIRVDVDPALSRYMIPKGSVAVDGVSLTINMCDDTGFELSIIPHTAGLTTVGFKQPGDKVNIETDLIGKYIERLLTRPAAEDAASGKPSGGVDLAMLARNGFI